MGFCLEHCNTRRRKWLQWWRPWGNKRRMCRKARWGSKFQWRSSLLSYLVYVQFDSWPFRLLNWKCKPKIQRKVQSWQLWWLGSKRWQVSQTWTVWRLWPRQYQFWFCFWSRPIHMSKSTKWFPLKQQGRNFHWRLRW